MDIKAYVCLDPNSNISVFCSYPIRKIIDGFGNRGKTAISFDLTSKRWIWNKLRVEYEKCTCGTWNYTLYNVFMGISIFHLS